MSDTQSKKSLADALRDSNKDRLLPFDALLQTLEGVVKATKWDEAKAAKKEGASKAKGGDGNTLKGQDASAIEEEDKSATKRDEVDANKGDDVSATHRDDASRVRKDEWVNEVTNFFKSGSTEGTSTAATWIDLTKKEHDKVGPGLVNISLANLVIGITFMREEGRNTFLSEREDQVSCDFIWSIVREALIANPDRFEVRRSAVGFLSVALCNNRTKTDELEELWRLHVWMPDGNRGNDEFDTHAHEATGQSWVLAGQGDDKRWDVYWVKDGHDKDEEIEDNTLYSRYRVSWDKMINPDSSTLVNMHDYCHKKLDKEHSGVVKRDMTYVIEHEEVHSSHVAPLVFMATFFGFDASRGYQKEPPLLGPKDGRDTTTTGKDPGRWTVLHLVYAVENQRWCEDSLQAVEEAKEGEEGQVE